MRGAACAGRVGVRVRVRVGVGVSVGVRMIMRLRVGRSCCGVQGLGSSSTLSPSTLTLLALTPY